MKDFTNAIIFVSCIASVCAIPAGTAEAEHTTTDNGLAFVGDSVDFSVQCAGWLTPHADCTPGKCQCAGNYGCWSCSGGRMQCQPGPGSGQCWK
ncbi:hypothetical protein ETB97_009223 [Aspergillus alliaceus]|uniref:Uncharacterized protein n=1 Tax=Petromyces alliaceus TaxID=209559 RepID=A0A8H6E248_PETAA|nr:hypothetical protein ETB97_009223 [Aspergillus burnettii]